MSNLKKLGQNSRGLGQHGDRDDWILWYDMALHVLCDKTFRLTVCVTRLIQRESVLVVWLCANGFRGVCDGFEHGLRLMSPTGMGSLLYVVTFS